jgi:ankyrin repeat protein
VQAALVGDEFGIKELAGLSKSGKEDLNSALFAASLGENSCVVKVLLRLGAEPNAQSEEGNTPLMNAAGSGHVGNVKALLEAGADINAKDRYGRSVLSAAERSQYSDVIKLLRDMHAK